MVLTDFYYSYVVGEFPEDKNNYNKTKLLFDYLLEAGIDEGNLLLNIMKTFPNKDYLTIDDIPDTMWEDSLLKRNTFYYHKELQILSPPPTWDECYPFYLEMKIQYKEKDVLNYFAKTFNINSEWINEEQEIGAIKYLINNYKKFNFMEPVDFLLHLIDYVKSLGVKANKIYDIRSYENELAELLEKDILDSKINKKDTVVWRTDVLCT